VPAKIRFTDLSLSMQIAFVCLWIFIIYAATGLLYVLVVRRFL
jgi:hypothetical protein